jgi:hypothetical protein
LLLALLCAALLLLGCGDNAKRDAASNEGDNPDSDDRATASADSSATDPEPLTRSQAEEISGRNIFAPLASDAREEKPKPASGGTKSTSSDASEAPPDPMADIALTGIVQIGGELTALVENIKTGGGDFGAEGEEVMGFRLAAIRRGEIELRGPDGKMHTVKMGGKEIADTTPGAAAKSATTTSETKPDESSRPTPSAGRGGFDPDRYRQWLETLTPEQREAFERRRRERTERFRGTRGGG